jgi:3,4-dihydroxybenzoate---[aryl-carrier protein] ligase
MIQIDDRIYDREHFAAASARHVERLGLEERRGRYAVCFADTAEWLSLFFAIRSAGATVLPIHPGTPYPAARALAVKAGCDGLLYDSLSAEPLGEPASSAGEGTLLQMSSGTTGEPKCIARTWAEIDREVETYVSTFREPQEMSPVIACPTTHSYGLICGILVALRRGQRPVIVNTANPKYILKTLREVERSLLYSSPAILNTLARLLPEGEKIHAVMTSGTLLPDTWFAQIRARARHMFQQYGCSEAGCIAINPEVEASADMGFALPHQTVETGMGEAPQEIVISAAGRRIHTRDLGYRRPDGMLVFVSRMDDMINVSGLNVYPQDVEDAVMAMPAVTDAVAFRRADRFAGERVGLVFSAEERLSREDVREWCLKNLGQHQVPTEILQLDAVPRQANGKINRREIAALHEAGRLAQPAEAMGR